jgi:paraquat-inducible protein A
MKGTSCSLDDALALCVGGLILLAVASLSPLLSLRMEGRIQDATLMTGAGALAEQGLWALAGLTALTTVALPLFKLGATAYTLLALKRRASPGHLARLFAVAERLKPWAMIEVYLLGLFVAYAKLSSMATIDIGVAVYALAALMIVMVTLDAGLDREAVWRRIGRPAPPEVHAGSRDRPPVRCGRCSLVSPAPSAGAACPRCGASRRRRKPDSVARTWALVVTAMILYVPANTFPIMTVISFGTGDPDTIVSGVRHLLEAGMWPLALLVFFASITVPVLKLSCLIVLLISTQRASAQRLADRTTLYRIIEAVGRWSMIDIFMLSILVGLVRLGSIATIAPGVGALAFAAVVLITMVAVLTFDPRLMWDVAGRNP